MNQNIYNVNEQLVAANLTPPNHRTPNWLSWLNALLYPLQWIHDNFFNDYANGSVYPFYSTGVVYNIGNRVIDIDNAVYECEVNGFGNTLGWNSGTTFPLGGYTVYNNQVYQSLQANNIGNVPSVNNSIWWVAVAPHLTPSQWWLVSPDYRGVRPRTNFNGTLLVLTGILNQFFRTTFRQPSTGQLSDIYIQNNILQNFVFVCGESEAESSVCVALNNQAINFIESQNSDYNFLGDAFTIYVPASLYWTLCGSTSIAGVGITSGGKYSSAVVEGVTFTGGGGSGAAGTTVMAPITGGFSIISVTMSNHGSNYTSEPTVVVAGGSPAPILYTIPTNTTEGDNRIKNIANRYVIAGMIYNVQPY